MPRPSHFSNYLARHESAETSNYENEYEEIGVNPPGIFSGTNRHLSV